MAPFTDFFAGAYSCPTATAGPTGVTACEDAWAGYYTLAGFIGVMLDGCARVYEDAAGRTCVAAGADTNLVDLAALRPVCL